MIAESRPKRLIKYSVLTRVIAGEILKGISCERQFAEPWSAGIQLTVAPYATPNITVKAIVERQL